MCGRYTLTATTDRIVKYFDSTIIQNLVPRFNVAPSQLAPVVRQLDKERKLDLFRWGIIPSWSKKGAAASGLINARAETVCEKSSFQESYTSRRCLVPADGFYEWRKEGSKKQPFRIGFHNGELFAFAGLYQLPVSYKDSQNRSGLVGNFAIITTAANKKIAPLHHRMPVIVKPTDFERWLKGGAKDAQAIMKPFDSTDMVFYRVSRRVNNVKNDDKSCIYPL
tara:strand:+ start:3198 stop:3866 length:669 start_codon:yes stop_codon:yes gene_type:complete